MAKRPITTPAPAKKSSHALPPIAVFCGPEDFLRTQKTAELREQLAKAHGTIDAHVFDGENASAADVLDECRSFGLIASHKLIVLDNAHELVKDETRGLFERYAQAPSEGATLVLRSHAWKSGKLDTMIVDAGGVVVKCEPPTAQEAVAWVRGAGAKIHRCTIEPDAAEMLVARVGQDLSRLGSELGKLAVASMDGDANPVPITRATVVRFVGLTRDEEAWGIQKTLLAGNPAHALAHIRHVIDVSRQPVPLVMYAVTDLARKLHGASEGLHAGTNPGALMKTLRLWGPSADAILHTARNLHPSRTLAFLRACVRADTRSKTGLTDADRAIEMLVIELQCTLHPT